ncbi:hypothetical protein E4U41_004125 [Claviceps citrina]|nr:hypothetical protein E4U41_004125 [Claviceps citrina]
MPRLDDAVRAAHRHTFLEALHEGSAKPYLIPYSILGTFIMPTLWLTVPHASRPWVYQTRWAVMAFVVLFNVHVMRVCSSTNFGCAYVCGVSAAWGIMQSMNLLLWKRPQLEAARVTRVVVAAKARARAKPADDAAGPNGGVTADGHADTRDTIDGGGLKHRKQVSSVPTETPAHLGTPSEEHVEYRWQKFPAEAPFWDRLGWVLDLMSSLRGAGRSWFYQSCSDF